MIFRNDIAVSFVDDSFMTERIKAAIRQLPSEKQSQLARTTIHATGLAMAIPGLAKMIADQIGHTVTPYASETHPSIDGARTVLKELKFLRKIPATKTP